MALIGLAPLPVLRDHFTLQETQQWAGSLHPQDGIGSDLRVLSLSCVYPNPSEPGRGIFVRRRLEKLAELAEVKVIAPVSLLDYSNLRHSRKVAPTVPLRRHDGRVEVFHPRWAHPPFGTFLNPLCLSARVAPLAATLKRSYQFAVLDAHFAFADGITAALLSPRLAVPFTITLRGNEPMHAQSPMLRIQMKWALRRAARIITVSRRLAEFAAAMGVPAARIRVIPNGVDPSVFYPRDRAAARARYGIDANTLAIVSVGSLIERKGHHRIMRALHTLRASGLPVQLLIAGGKGREGKMTGEDLQRIAGELQVDGAVRFLGTLNSDALPELMSAADVFCLASSREGWPNVVHEALACGTPVVATDVGAVPDMVAPPAGGFVVPPDEPDALMAALRQALTAVWNRDLIRDRAHARGWDLVAREVFTELQAAAAEGRER